MLHQYGKRTIRQRMIREANARTETRDAILWAIYPDDRYATVKIQGSSTAIPVNFPENWEQTPVWLKPGNAVKIMHTGGNRNRVELVGHGLAVPTPTDNSAAAPTLEEGPNVVLTGMQVHAFPVPSMSVWVDIGAYRVKNVIYAFGASLTMTADSDIAMGDALLMGTTGDVVEINAADATMFRIDIISIGESGDLTYTAGTPHATNPQMPDTPAGHARVCWILIPPGTTEVTTDLINRNYVEPFVSQLIAAPTSLELNWLTSSGTIQVDVLDQYERGITTQNWQIKAEILSGSGTINGSTTSSTRSVGSGNYSTTFTYRRVSGYDNLVDPPDESGPVYIEFSLIQDPSLTMLTPVILLDLGGDVII